MRDPEAVYQRQADLSWTEMDGETVVLNVDANDYFGLGGVGTRIWELLARPVTAGQICAGLAAEYDVDADACLDDVLGFLAQLLASGMIRQR